LIDLSDAFIILPGKSGTIAELAFLWALDRARALGDKPIVLSGASWPALVEAFETAGAIEPEQRRITSLTATPEDAVAEIARRLGAGSPGAEAP
jgi:predicted Rossmann-fold nucleotide-binding protein